MKNELEILIRARYPIISVLTWEEERVEEELKTIAKNSSKNVFSWSVTRGIMPLGASIQSKKILVEGSTDPLVALQEVLERIDPAIYVFKDFHPYLTNPEIVRKLRELAQYLKESYKTLIIISPQLKIPLELEKDITVIDYCLPDYETLNNLIEDVVNELNKSEKIKVSLSDDARERLIKSLMGLTLKEAENVIARAIIVQGKLDESAVPVVLSEKKQIIRKSGVLEYYEYDEGFENVGGLETLKNWMLEQLRECLAGSSHGFRKKYRLFL
ncbi:MAG: hypothetical protein AB1349_06515 [Elusimicrobiota bacterium]